MAFPKAKNIAVKRGTVVMLRDGNGRLTGTKGIVLVNLKASNFSRAYGRQVAVCSIGGKKTKYPYVNYKGAGDLYPIGKVKRIPKMCLDALEREREYHPTLFEKRKKR